MLDKNQKIAIYMEDNLDSDYGKMGYGVMRYIPNPVVCVIDSTHKGMRVKDACSLPYDYPVVSTVEEAHQLGAEVLVLGTAPSGGRVPDEWYPPLREALQFGMSLVNGLHDKLNDKLGESIQDTANQWIWDVRQPAFTPAIAKGRAADLKNSRVLMVGTDMAIGKMTAGLEVYDWIRNQNPSTAFVATGQIGITITGHGIPLDAFKVDHACGAVETAVLEAADNDFIFIEGQGSLLHPGSSATLSLMRGSCANKLIMCHRAGMSVLRSPDHIKIPPLREFIQLNEAMTSVCGSLTAAKTIGVALNTSMLDEQDALAVIKQTEDDIGLPVQDVYRFGAEKLGMELLKDTA